MPISQGKDDISQRTQHWKESVSMEQFINHARGKSLNILHRESGPDIKKIGPISREYQLGPKGHRYVKDPIDPSRNGEPGDVIDMRHFIESAMFPVGLGEYAGAAVEIQQSTNPKTQGSAHFSEDYKSNFLGVVFRNNYWKNDKDVSDEFRQFFQDYQKGQLKGFWPAIDKATAELGRKGAAGVKKLEQLTEMAADYAARMGQQGIQHLKNMKSSLEQILRTNPIDSIRTLIDKLSSAEQAIIAQQGQHNGVEVAHQEPQNSTLEALNPGLYEALERITDYTSLQETYLSQNNEPTEVQQINNPDLQIAQTSPEIECG
jgi:hypothetical protein